MAGQSYWRKPLDKIKEESERRSRAMKESHRSRSKALLVGIGERGANDVKVMLKIVEDMKPGDVVWMQYSGRGCEVPAGKVKVSAPHDLKWKGPKRVRVKAKKKNAKNKIHRKAV